MSTESLLVDAHAVVAAAEHGLKVYRDRHRSGVMARASEAFKTISMLNIVRGSSPARVMRKSPRKAIFHLRFSNGRLRCSSALPSHFRC